MLTVTRPHRRIHGRQRTEGERSRASGSGGGGGSDADGGGSARSAGGGGGGGRRAHRLTAQKAGVTAHRRGGRWPADRARKKGERGVGGVPPAAQTCRHAVVVKDVAANKLKKNTQQMTNKKW
jgi:hypothetical protein